MPTFEVTAPNGAVYEIDTPEGATEQDAIAYLAAQLGSTGARGEDVLRERLSGIEPDFSLGELGSRGLSRGFSRLGSTVTDILPALGGAALGFEDYAREQLAEAAAKEEELQRVNPAEYQSFRDVEGISDVPGFIMETLGEQAANILPSLVSGVGLGALGARTAATAATRGIVEKELRDAALKQAAGQIARGRTTGQIAGVATGSYALNAPEVFQNIYEETGELAPGAAAAFGMAAAALDSILPAQLARSLTGPMKVGVTEALLARSGMDRGFLRKLAAGTLGGVATEGPTEAAQEAISIAAERFVAENPEAFTEREIERIKESFVRGAVAGGGLSAVGAVPEGVRESAAVAQEKAAAPVVEDDLAPPSEGAAPTPPPAPTTPSAEPEAAAPQPTVRAQPAAPAPASPRMQEILRRMGYNEELVNAFNAAQATAIIEQRNPEMLDYLDESVALPEAAAPTTPPAEPAGPTPQEELDALKAEVARSEAEGAARVAAVDTTEQRVEEAPESVQEELTQEPAPQIEPDTLVPTDPAALKAWGKANLGVGPTSNLFKPGNVDFIGGKDLADPEQAAQVRAVVEKYRKGRSPDIAVKMGEFLARPEFGVDTSSVGPTPRAELPQGPKLRKLPAAVIEQADRLSGSQPPIQPRKDYTPEQAAATFFRAYDPESAVRNMVAESLPEYTEEFTATTVPENRRQAVAQTALRWVVENMGPETTRAIEAYTKEFQNIRDRAAIELEERAAKQERDKAADAAQALGRAEKAEQETTKKVDAALRKQEAASSTVAPQKLDPATRKALKELDKRVAQEVERSEADTYTAASSARRPEKAEESRRVKSQTKMFELTGGKVEELPYTGPETVRWGKYYLENASNSPKLEGDLLDAVQAGNLKQTISLLLGKTAKRPEVQQILKRIQSMGLKTKIVVAGRPTLVRDELMDPPADVALAVQKGIEGKNALEAANFVASNATDPAHRVIAKAVAQRLRELAKAGTLPDFQVIHIGDRVRLDLHRQGQRGVYDPNNNTVYIKGADVTGSVGTTYETVLHELIHAVTVNLMYAGSDPGATDANLIAYAERMTEVRNAVVKHFNARVAESKRGKTKLTEFEQQILRNGVNTFDNVREVIAWAMTNAEAQAYMEGIPYQGKNVWTAFVQAVRRVLGLSPSADTALSEVLSVAEGYFGKSAARAATLTARSTTVGALPEGKAGSYDPVTDTITLDPELGLNEHTLIHELGHAALAERIADPKSKEAKAFGEFFQIVKNQLGGTYGGTDVQEFAAEIMGNEQFAASLKAIKAPKGGTLWQRIVQSIAEFFGFRKGESVYDASIKYINELLNVPESAEPTLSEKLYLTGDINGSAGRVWGGVKFGANETLGKLSNLDLKWRTFALGAASLNNMSRMFGKVLPIAALETALETKRGYIDNAVEELNARVRGINKTLKGISQATMDKANKLFIDMRIDGVDVLGIDPQYKASANPAQHQKYMDAFNALPKPVRDAYRIMRTDLRASMEQFAELIRTQVGGATGKQLAEDFMNLDGVIGYVPFRRVGDYWVSYTDPETQEPVVRAFTYARDRDKLVADLKAQGVEASAYINLDVGKTPQNLPPNTFVAKVISNLREAGASEATVDQVWQQYAEMFPARSIMQQMKRSKNRLGMDEDIVGAYADTQIKWVNKLANMQYNPQVDGALVEIEAAAKQHNSDPNIVAAADNILRQSAFYTNPQFHPITNALTQGSYIFMILGSLAASLVNLTGLPFLVGPTLAGRFGLSATSSAMMDAARIAHKDNWGSGKYKALYETLNARGLLKHTLTREALERGRTKGSDFQSVYSRVVEFFSIPFQASEKYARAVTVMAAYDLAMKGNKDLGVAPMSQEEAIEYAARMVKNTHTAGMVEVAPRFFQNDLGRVALTFKQIMFQQAAHVGFIMRKAWKGTPLPENATQEEIAEAQREQKVAMRQALGIYGTAFVFLGANGVPFGSALGTFLQIVNVASGGLVAVLFGMDEDEPFDPTVAASELFGDVFHKGLANSLLQIELSDRAGIANDILFRDAPEDVEQFGLVRTVLASLAGPMLGQAIMAERGFEYLREGKVDRALETVTPVFIRNGLRTFRFIAEDGARTTDGMPIEEDLNAWNLFTQLLGFTPAELSDTYAQRSAAKRVDNAVIARKQRIQDMYFTGRATGDQDLVREARSEAAEFRRRYPQLMDADTLDRSYRAKIASQREMLNGIRYTKGLRPELQERFELGN